MLKNTKEALTTKEEHLNHYLKFALNWLRLQYLVCQIHQLLVGNVLHKSYGNVLVAQPCIGRQ